MTRDEIGKLILKRNLVYSLKPSEVVIGLASRPENWCITMKSVPDNGRGYSIASLLGKVINCRDALGEPVPYGSNAIEFDFVISSWETLFNTKPKNMYWWLPEVIKFSVLDIDYNLETSTSWFASDTNLWQLKNMKGQNNN